MLDGLGVPAGFADVQAFVRGNGDEVDAVCSDEAAESGDVVVLGCALRLGGAAVGLPARQEIVEELRGYEVAADGGVAAGDGCHRGFLDDVVDLAGFFVAHEHAVAFGVWRVGDCGDGGALVGLPVLDELLGEGRGAEMEVVGVGDNHRGRGADKFSCLQHGVPAALHGFLVDKAHAGGGPRGRYLAGEFALAGAD